MKLSVGKKAFSAQRDEERENPEESHPRYAGVPEVES